jgi:hypothetical protein
MGSTLNKLIEKFEAAREEMRREGKASLKLAFKEIFDECPALKAVRWRQYTPYWSDGDTCTFRVRDFCVKFSDTPEEGGDYEDGFVYASSYKHREDSPEYASAAGRAAVKAVREVAQAPDEVFQLTFGDHVQVTATREGFEVEEYEHE